MILPAALLLAFTVATTPPDTAPARILVLYTHSPESPALAAFGRAFHTTIDDSLQLSAELYREFLDTDRFPGNAHWEQLSQYLARKYDGVKLDVIVAEGSVALHFATERLKRVMPDVPIVFAVAIEPPPDLRTLPANVTGRLTPLPFASTLALARRLQPDAQRVVVVASASALDSSLRAAAVSATEILRDSLPVVITPNLSYEELLTYLHALPRRTIVLLPLFRRDRLGRTFVPGLLIRKLTSVSAAPIYGVIGSWVGAGVTGGDAIEFDEEGMSTARLVLRVLHRKHGEPLPPLERSVSRLFVDWRQLQRFDISEARVPPNAEILFREPTTWQRHRVPILTAFAVIATQFFLIGLLLIERSARLRANSDLARQAEYEQMIADVTAQTVRAVVHDDASGAFDTALSRIASYAHATHAILDQYGSGPNDVPVRVTWEGTPHERRYPAVKEMALEIPLLVEQERIGMLTLYRRGDEPAPWPQRVVERLDPAVELIASAMARSQSARSAHRGEELNRAVLASLSAQVAILDRDGMIIRVNETWRGLAQQMGVSRDRDGFCGMNYLDECRRAEDRGCPDAGEVRRGIRQVLDRRQWSFRYEYHVNSPELRWYELRVDRLEYGETGAIVMHLDITERRVAELRVEETRRQMAHMGRVATVGELTAAVSHELRQPLASIRANGESGLLMLGKSPPDLRGMASVFRDLIEDTDRATEIVEHVRLLLRNGDGQTSRVDVNEICRQALHLLQRDALFRQTQLDLLLEPSLKPVLGDPVQLQQVVLNLALNALDAASTSKGERAVVIRTVQDDGMVELSIRDTGPGLPPEVRRHLFEPFFSTKSQGLGLGLSIVRGIVERHNGRIGAENLPARGAVFRVLLPTP